MNDLFYLIFVAADPMMDRFDIFFGDFKKYQCGGPGQKINDTNNERSPRFFKWFWIEIGSSRYQDTRSGEEIQFFLSYIAFYIKNTMALKLSITIMIL